MVQAANQGFLGDLSPQQEAVMLEIEQWLASETTMDAKALLFDRTHILRFCRARKFDVVKIKTMLGDFAQWRADQNIDVLLDTWHWPRLDYFKTLYPHGAHKTDKLGRPLQIERPGVADLDAIFRDVPPDELIRNLSWQCEWFVYHVYPSCARTYNLPVDSTVQIFDLTDGNVGKMMSRQSLRLLKMGAKIAQDYYPETMGACYVVNAPMLFSALYAIVKGFLDERTRSKVRIIGSNYQAVLLEAIDADNLPAFLGGNCTCSHVQGGCMVSGAGPWNDYVTVNREIKHKRELEEAKTEELKTQELAEHQDDGSERHNRTFGPPLADHQTRLETCNGSLELDGNYYESIPAMPQSQPVFQRARDASHRS